MKNIQDIRQRDSEYYTTTESIREARSRPEEYELPRPIKKKDINEYSIFNPWILMILFLVGLGLTLVGAYKAGYKQAKIDYGINLKS